MQAITKKALEQHGWVYVPGGPALIGADSPGEGPPVVLDIPAFHIGRHAVSNEEFECFRRDGGYRRPEFWDMEAFLWIQSSAIKEPAFWRDNLFNNPGQPATGVSFHEAQAFARWRSARLPTEVEWEKAARGPSGQLYPWGDDEPDMTHANFAPGYVPINRSTIRVEDCPNGDSPYGCRQMAGNVYEWCSDFFHANTPTQRNPGKLIVMRPSLRRVMKGGSWGSGASRLRASARWSSPPELRDNVIGFRLVVDG